MKKIRFEWVGWHGRRPVDIRSAHLIIPGTDKTPCGLDRALGQGAKSIGFFVENQRPDCQCCSWCMEERKKIADRIRLQEWNEASV